MRCLAILICALLSGAAAAQAELSATVVATAQVPNAAGGFTAVNLRFDATYWVLGADGLQLHHLYIDWQSGSGRILSTETLHDAARAQLRVHGMQVLASSAWFADESGPYLAETDLHGRLLGKYAALVDGAAATRANLRRGFGGLAASRDERFLYAAFEGPLWTGTGWEASVQGRAYARVLEFEIATRRWTGRSLRYPLEAAANEIADLRFVDSRTALVLERGKDFRRIYRVLLAGDELAKAAFVDVLRADIAAAEGLEIIEPGYIVLSSAARPSLVLLRSPDLLFPAFERSRP